MNVTTQELTNAGLRKAAILVACLDRAAADAVLEQLSPEQARRIRQAVVVLEDIPDDEKHHIVNEFFRLGPEKPPRQSAGVELGGRLAREIGYNRSDFEPKKAAVNATRPKTFVRLREAENEKLSRLLAAERPQTIALVLSHLSARQAGGVLARLQPNIQTEVVRRLVDLEETDPAVLQEVEQTLENRLSQQVHMQRRRVAGLSAVNGILEASESDVRLQILNNLASRDQALAERLAPPSISMEMEFDDLAGLDDAVLTEVFRAADPQWIIPALFGALPEITQRVLRFLPRAQAESLSRKLQQPGPIRLSDMETARQRIAETASKILYANKDSEVRVQGSEFDEKGFSNSDPDTRARTSTAAPPRYMVEL
jgi:flagellar motor switch protein FliG